MKIHNGSGFTLIELMITVAIVGILASIALPSYDSYIKRANRLDAKSALLENAQFLERNYTENNKYNLTSSGADITLPITVSPASGTTLYTIILDSGTLTATTYTLYSMFKFLSLEKQ